MADAAWPRVLPSAIHDFVCRCIENVGGATEHAQNLAEVLTLADRRGHYSHGINRLELYVRDMQKGFVHSTGSSSILKETVATAWVDGNNLLGPSVGRFCMELAIHKARQVGVGFVVAKGSNHYGIAGWYSMMAQQQGLIGFSFTNTSPVIVPTRAKQRHLGTNPISMAAPAGDDSFVLDMATSTVALGKIEVAERSHLDVPETWGCDASGLPCTNPTTILHEGGLYPLGGSEQSGGYKGCGLSLMVDILCGVLSGASYGSNIPFWMNEEGQLADLGHCFIAVDPSVFASNFEERLGDFINSTRNLEPSEENNGVLVAGDPERRKMQDAEVNGGVPYNPHVLTAMDVLADELNIERLIRNI